MLSVLQLGKWRHRGSFPKITHYVAMLGAELLVTTYWGLGNINDSAEEPGTETLGVGLGERGTPILRESYPPSLRVPERERSQPSL